MNARGLQLRLLAPNALSATNIATGFLSMTAAADGRFELAVYLLLVSLTLDTLDGAVARWLRATSDFGKEMDSFSDAVSFGVAPALLLYLVFLKEHGLVGLAVVLLYLLAAVFRLTRFVLSSSSHVKAERTCGVPVPIAASYVMAMVLMRDHISVQMVVAVSVGFSLLMVSRLRLPNLRGSNLVSAMLLVGVVNYYAVVISPSWMTIAWWNLWNAVILTMVKLRDRKLAQSSA